MAANVQKQKKPDSSALIASLKKLFEGKTLNAFDVSEKITREAKKLDRVVIKQTLEIGKKKCWKKWEIANRKKKLIEISWEKETRYVNDQLKQKNIEKPLRD